MDLKYRILWFDNQPQEVTGAESVIKANLTSVGISLEVTWVSKFDEDTLNPHLTTLRNYTPYDLIVVDYDLGSSKGDALLQRLRRYTSVEMVFYSAIGAQKLREALITKKIDGIFCLNRDQRLGQEMFAIVKCTLRRFFHPNYIRGLVVGAVSEIDYLLVESIEHLLTIPAMPEKEEMKNRILEAQKSYLDQSVGEQAKAESKPFDRLLKKANLKIKVDMLIYLLEQQGGRIAIEAKEIVSLFMDEINENRIEFAHAKTEEVNGLPVFRDRNRGKVWDTSEMENLIRNIQKHKNAMMSIRSCREE
ncbi:hypothetical protein [Undibacterium fentianense]|uniref:Uncharacterized protein n=1 Tax=Undibacterium fentianense TaxID=2828728 RepID=A0A941E5H7_9BURK|nr:hypothetical protein [Undibacterium fentianense]MBR7801447.1 hypothetical protein [Undibacterium fentianense]